MTTEGLGEICALTLRRLDKILFTEELLAALGSQLVGLQCFALLRGGRLVGGDAEGEGRLSLSVLLRDLNRLLLLLLVTHLYGDDFFISTFWKCFFACDLLRVIKTQNIYLLSD